MDALLKVLIPVVLVLAIIGGLVYWQYNELQNITADLTSASVSSVSLTGASADFSLAITNPSYVPLDISNLHMDILAANTPLGKIDSGEFELPVRSTIEKNFTFSIRFADVGLSVLNALRTQQINWRVEGDATILLPFGLTYDYMFELPQNNSNSQATT